MSYEQQLDATFQALADPTRRAILARLARGDATVNQLAEPFAMTQQAVSKHLKVLARARLISRTRSAQSRPCALDTVHLDAAAGWIARHRQVWADRHDRLDEHLAALRSGQRPMPVAGTPAAGAPAAGAAGADEEGAGR